MALKYVDKFCDTSSDASDEDNEEDGQPKRKRRRTNRSWVQKETFDTPKEAEAAVKARNIWKISSTKETTAGRRVNYRCTAGQYRLNECPAGVYLLYDSTSNQVTSFKTEETHANHVTEPVRGLPSNVKSFVQAKYADGITKPNQLMDRIRKEKLRVPHKAQLVSFLQAL